MVTSFGLHSGHHQTVHCQGLKKKLYGRLNVTMGEIISHFLHKDYCIAFSLTSNNDWSGDGLNSGRI
jgi:hypothetical protein